MKMNRGQPSDGMRSRVRVFTGLALAACALVLLSITAYAAKPDREPDSAYYAANPELMVAGRYTAARTDSAYMAANPELAVAHSYYGAKLVFPRRPVLSYRASQGASLAFPRRPVLRYDASGADQRP